MDEEVDRLYGLPQEEFVAERDALAKRLRADKRSDDAAKVKALRKPSVAAWAVNQVLRGRRADQSAVLEAADALRFAQKDLLAGRGDATAVRTATEAERKAVDRLVKAAGGLTHGDGFLSDSVLDRVRETLRAAATDDEARAEVEAARVTRERKPAAFGGLEGFAATAPPKPRTQPGTRRGPRDKAEASDRREQEKQRKAEERERRRTAEAALKKAKADERAASRRRRDAESAIEKAEKTLAKAQGELEAAAADEQEAGKRRAAAENELAG